METTNSLIPNKSLRLIDFIVDTIIYLVITSLIIVAIRDTTEQQYVRYISAGIYFFYYFIFEYFSGQTPGKMITKTQIVYNNQEFKILKLFTRTIIRFIPIDILSYLFFKRGLHDWISNTKLIKRQ
ncbi:RDD family protein [Maribellus sp. YY47]|uniref:RDD family protein n=1 Tax=Maribellus sp. YY47 TaxID=2929486 RepID=UPI002000BE2B|nr:RDD family protein [Maribellus sp. YY47]MCK3686387.1 RDD family protein [Maribellus sp. YY47]